MITVVITTYKRSPIILKRAIDSVINQTYKDWELYVIDDSPNDYEERKNVKKIVDDFNNSKITYIQQSKNMGACKARNRGIALAKGDFIAFLDDDDVWDKTKLEKQLDKFNELDDRYALVYCGSVYYNTKKNKFKVHDSIFKSGEVFDELIMKNFIGGASFPLIKTKVIKELGGFDEELLACQDLDMWLRISKKYYIDYVSEPLVIYYIHDGEQISTNPKKRLQGTKRKIEKYKEYLESHPKQYNKCLLEYAYALAMSGDIKVSINTWKKAKKISKTNIKENIISFLRILKCYIKYK